MKRSIPEFHSFRSATELLAVWPNTLKVYLPDQDVPAASGMRATAVFTDGNKASFQVQEEGFERSLYVAGFRMIATRPCRVWQKCICTEDWYGGSRYEVV